MSNNHCAKQFPIWSLNTAVCSFFSPSFPSIIFQHHQWSVRSATIIWTMRTCVRACWLAMSPCRSAAAHLELAGVTTVRCIPALSMAQVSWRRSWVHLKKCAGCCSTTDGIIHCISRNCSLFVNKELAWFYWWIDTKLEFLFFETGLKFIASCDQSNRLSLNCQYRISSISNISHSQIPPSMPVLRSGCDTSARADCGHSWQCSWFHQVCHNAYQNANSARLGSDQVQVWPSTGVTSM